MHFNVKANERLFAGLPKYPGAELKREIGTVIVDAVVDLRADRAALDRVAGTVVLNRAELSLSGVSFDQQTPTRLLVHDGRLDVAAASPSTRYCRLRSRARVSTPKARART